jgi:hypothetical protein
VESPVVMANLMSGRDGRLVSCGKPSGMLLNAALDKRQVLFRPPDCSYQTLLETHRRLECEVSLSFLGAADALPSMIPAPARQELNGSGIAGQPVDVPSKVEDRRFDAASEVIHIAGFARRRAGEQS